MKNKQIKSSKKNSFKKRKFSTYVKKIITTTLAVLIALSTFAMPTVFADTEVYHNEDGTVNVYVNRTQGKDGTVLQFEPEVTEGSNIDIKDIVYENQSIKKDDFSYYHVVREDGNYKFTVSYTRIVHVVKENKELEDVTRNESFDIYLDVEMPIEEQIDTVESISSDEEVSIEPQTSQSLDDIDETEEFTKLTVERTLSEIPSLDEINGLIGDDEMILYYPESGKIEIVKRNEITNFSRASNSVTTGEKLSTGVSFYYAPSPSYAFNFPGGFSEIFVNGQVAFCIEPSVLATTTSGASSTDLSNLDELRVMDGRLSFRLTPTQKINIQLISNYGYSYPGHQTQAYRWATQLAIFEALGWKFTSYGSLSPTAELAEIRRLIDTHNDVPSWNNTTKDVVPNQIIDLSGSTLSLFDIYSSTGVQIIENSGNTLKVKIIADDAKIVLSRKMGSHGVNSYVYSDGSSQKVLVGGLDDPNGAIIKFKYSLGDLEIGKKDAQDIYYPGVVFELSKNKTTILSTHTTTENGRVKITGLESGTYYYREKSVVSPLIIDSSWKTVEITGGTTTSVTAVNDRAMGQIKGKKLSTNGTEIPFVTFNILNADRNVSDTVITDSKGEFTSKLLPLGEYVLVETSVPTNIVLDPTPIPVTIKYKDQVTSIILVTKNITNKYQRADVTVTKTEDNTDVIFTEFNGKKLDGVEIGIYAKSDIFEGSVLVYRSGELIGKEVTNSVGQVSFHNLPIGEFYLKELKTIEGYQLFEGQWDVSIKYDRNNPTVEITQVGKTVTNTPITGSVRLIKSDGTASNLLKDAEFELYRSSDNKHIGTYISDEYGQIQVDGLRFSKNNGYYFKETKCPWGYWINEDPIYFDITTQDELVYLIAPNNLIEVHVEWNKVNEDGLPLNGVGFRIRNIDTNEFVTLIHADGKTLVEETEWFTDHNGDVFINGLITAGEYELVETSMLPGYQPIAPVAFTVDETQTYINLGVLVGLSLDLGEIINYWNRGNIEILKLDIDTQKPLAEFGFNLYFKNKVVGYYETGSNGKVTLPNLQYGVYDIEEIKVGGDYGIDPNNNRQQIFVEEHGHTYSVTFLNKHSDIKTSASFVERDKDEPQLVTLVDVVSYTDLLPGKEYEVKGFLMDKELNEPILIDGQQITAETIFTPTTKDGTVEVVFIFDSSKLETKTIVVFEDLHRDNKEVVVHHDINDIEQTVEIPEIGTTASFTERDKVQPNLVTLTDEIRYSGLVIGSEYTVSGHLMDGTTSEPLLIDGEEVTAQKTFVAEANEGTISLDFTFDQNMLETDRIVVFESLSEGERLIAIHADTNDVDQTVEVKTIRIIKVDSKSNAPLEGVEFTITDASGTVIFVGLTNEFGIVEFNILDGEIVAFEETLTLDAYTLIEGQTQVDSSEIDNGIIEFIVTNQKTVIDLQVQKLDEDTMEPLLSEHVEFTVYDVSSLLQTRTKEQIQVMATNGTLPDVPKLVKNSNDIDGITHFDITAGSYLVKETGTAPGYSLSDEYQWVDITGAEEKQTITILYSNKHLPTVVLPKTGIAASPMMFLGLFSSILGVLFVLLSKTKQSILQFLNSLTTERIDVVTVDVLNNVLIINNGLKIDSDEFEFTPSKKDSIIKLQIYGKSNSHTDIRVILKVKDFCQYLKVMNFVYDSYEQREERF